MRERGRIESDAALLQWIERGLKKRGKNRSGLARSLSIHPSQITKLLSNKRSIKTRELATIAQYLEDTPPASGRSTTGPILVDVIAETAADVWVRAESYDGINPTRAVTYPEIPVVPKFKSLPQFAVKVNGESSNSVINAGSFVVCVPFWRARPAPSSGDLVLVERKQGELLELSIRRIIWVPSAAEWRLCFESREPQFQNSISLGSNVSQELVEIDGAKLRLVGLLIWKAQPLSL